MRAIGTDDATDGHEETVDGIIALSLCSGQGGERGRGVYPRYIPKSRTRSEHELAQCPHNTIRASTILKNRDGSLACEHAGPT